MHVPDGFLDAKTTAVTLALGALGLGWAARRARASLPPRKIPLLGLAAAFVFAAQMLNFPVAGGTSGHLLGGVLAAVLLGPSAGVVVIASVLVVQCLVFADGGLLALGANIFNMAVVGAAGGYGVYALVRRRAPGLRGRLMAAAFASWCSVVLASSACAVELAASGAVAWNVVFPAMAGIHMLIGVGEAVITALVLVAVSVTRPELLGDEAQPVPAKRYASALVYGLLIALGLAVLVSPFASPSPDGLEKVAEMLGFGGRAAETPLVPSPIPDYEMPGMASPTRATAAAGAVGTVIMFGVAYLLARRLVPAEKKKCATTS